MSTLGNTLQLKNTSRTAPPAIPDPIRFDAQKLLHNLQTALLIIDSKTFEIRWTNASAERLLGLPSHRLLGRNCHEIICSKKDDVCPFADLKRNVLHHEYELKRDDGVTVHVLKTVQRMRFKGKDVFVESLIDISEQRATIRRLLENEKRFHNMTEILPEAIFETDSELNVTYANEAGLQMFGLSNTDLKNGLHGLDVFVPEDHKRAMKNIMLRKKGSLNKGKEYKARRKDGTVFPIFFHPRLIYVNDIFVGLCGIITDLSEQKRIQKLQTDKELAEETNRTKNMFLQNMTHELRTPLTPIIGFTDIMLESDNLSDQQKDYLQIIKQRGHDLLRLINGIVDVVKVESNKIELTHDCIDIRSLLDDVYNFFEISIKDLNIWYALEVSPFVPDQVRLDPACFQQILLNLVDNAVKFSADGSIHVYADYDTTKTPSQLVVRVCDTGPGIKPDAQDCIFEPFFQTADSPNHSQKGTGLGLAICRRLATRMGGYLSVESTIDKGSEFTFAVDAPSA